MGRESSDPGQSFLPESPSGVILIMEVTFEWDEDKARENLSKHNVNFKEAKTVFMDPFSVTIPDPDHSVDEERLIDIGASVKGRILVVVYVERGARIRLISGRKATQAERRRYEEGYV